MKAGLSKILIIQTAFLGDVILATSIIEKLHEHYPESRLDFLLRKGNETLLTNHPHLTKIYVWNKQTNKVKNIYFIIQQIRAEKYDLVINLQRFFSSGLFAAFSGATQIVGFKNNPLSFLFSSAYPHQIGDDTHEIARNQALIANFTNHIPKNPKLYPTSKHYTNIEKYQTNLYICLAPSSVWFTKQYPLQKWVELLNELPQKFTIYLLGSPADVALCEQIIEQSQEKKQKEEHNQIQKQHIESLCGKLNLLESAALMQDATMNYVNDSAPLHIASAMNAPVCAIFCSTVPSFGFTPLSAKSFVIEVSEKLACRPCGLHGHKQCPKGHFLCGYNIETQKLLQVLN